MSSLQFFYPESVKCIVFINTTAPFRILYKILSPLIHPRTRDCIQITVSGSILRGDLAYQSAFECIFVSQGGPLQYWPVLQQAGITAQLLPKTLGGTLSDEGYIQRHCAEAFRRARNDEWMPERPQGSGADEVQQGDHRHFNLTVLAGAKKSYTLQYGQNDESVAYTLHVGGNVPGMDIGFQSTYQPESADGAAEIVDTWARRGMESDITNVRSALCIIFAFYDFVPHQTFSRVGAGTLVFEFDNSYSYWRCKYLSFDVQVTRRAPQTSKNGEDYAAGKIGDAMAPSSDNILWKQVPSSKFGLSGRFDIDFVCRWLSATPRLCTQATHPALKTLGRNKI
jgi:hypothetical protein